MQSASRTPNVLIVLTSCNSLSNLQSSSEQQNRQTGYSVKQLAYLYEKLIRPNPNLQWTIATPKGSAAPMDPSSPVSGKERDATVDAFMKNESFQRALRTTTPLRSIQPGSLSAVLFCGGPGASVDFRQCDSEIQEIVNAVYNRNGGIVACIGHGLSALASEKICREDGKPFLRDRTVTGATREEEHEMSLDDYLPMNLEEECSRLGAKFSAKSAFTPNVEVSERLVTGQNDASAESWAEHVMSTCRKHHPSFF